jgi:hypothetical protein
VGVTIVLVLLEQDGEFTITATLEQAGGEHQAKH